MKEGVELLNAIQGTFTSAADGDGGVIK